MDKELATKLADALESMWVENLALRGFVNGLHKLYLARLAREPNIPRSPTPAELIEASRRIGGTLSLVQDMLRPVRAEIESAKTLDQVIERILLAIPKSREVN